MMLMKFNRILTFLLTTESGARCGLGSAVFFAALALLSGVLILSHGWADLQLASLKEVEGPRGEAWSLSLSEESQALAQAHLFGYRAQASAYIPITNSQVRLTGVIQQGSEEEQAFSKAIISVQGGIGKVYQVGESVLDGVKITDIQAGAVILDNNGHSERLPLQRARLRGT